MDLDIPPFEQTYDEHKQFVQNIVHIGAQRLQQRWFAKYPIYDVEDIPHLVRALRELVVTSGGVLPTAHWECSDKYLEYGYYVLTVEFYKYV
jgi:predicted ester cyclase